MTEDPRIQKLCDMAEAAIDARDKFSAALTAISHTLNLPGSPDLAVDVPRAVEKAAERIARLTSDRERLAHDRDNAKEAYFELIKRCGQVTLDLEGYGAVAIVLGKDSQNEPMFYVTQDDHRKALSTAATRITILEMERDHARAQRNAMLQALDKAVAEKMDMTDRYHEASGEADRLHDQIDHAAAYRTKLNTWATEAPTREGPYWVRFVGSAARVCRVYDNDGCMVAVEPGVTTELRVKCDYYANCEWLGPLEAPK